jgi:hypothetical protein
LRCHFGLFASLGTEGTGLEIIQVYKDHGISGAKGKDKRPQFDALQ